ncbi:MAG: DUF2922 domain-containing protein [Firmicutes bacterium]|nr:DUF2922 domain-containing protein [Bacillota bacterium]HOB34242.1 DUF2922 domain-containing protein [Bacillota bacterium]HPZ89953.1 DUF2922 domain-containing protein [Bacillota bacterium]HQE01359.1 DUF2922 domain-containing protein [Bacillota bacterium]
MDRTLQLVFLNAEGGRVTINVPEPLDELDPAAVEQAMDAVIAADVVTTSGGGLIGKVRATIVSRTDEVVVEF